MAQLRIAVAADIHSDDRVDQGTYVRAEPPSARPRQHPLADLVEYVRSTGLTADYLLAAGDIANQANAVGLSYGWRKAQTLANALGAKLLGVPGNHDVVTHEQVDDPRLALKTLLPSFPSGDAHTDEHFWSNGWALLEEADHRVLMLDSTLDFPTHPGEVARDSKEWAEYLLAIDRGGFPTEVEDQVAAALQGLDEKLNVAVLHHHPVEHQNHEWLKDPYGPMRRGGELIDVLSRSDAGGRWLVVHGHKHVPQLVSATSITMNGPVVLCGASIGAKLWDPISTMTRNQFHVVTVLDDGPMPLANLVGTIDSYTWGFGYGWQASERRGAGLPATTGFGCTENFRTLAVLIERALEEGGTTLMNYEDLLSAVPQLPYVMPVDWDYLEDHLASRGVTFDRNRLNRIVQVSREVRAA